MAVDQSFPRGTFKVEPGPGKNEGSVIFKPTQSIIVFSITRPGEMRYNLAAVTSFQNNSDLPQGPNLRSGGRLGVRPLCRQWAHLIAIGTPRAR